MAALSAPLPASRDSNEGCAAPAVRPQRSDRSAGKGRRRRAAAEQRRTEQEHRSRLMHDTEEEFFVAPRPVSRRQSRRAARHSTRDEWEDCLLFDGFVDDDDLDVALAVTLSLSETSRNVNGDNQNITSGTLQGGILDMSYENLVLLENVKCAASPALVKSLSGHVFAKSNHASSLEVVDELCTICQNEYNDGDSLLVLPCMHTFHDVCGSEWLLNHSKLCPVCKHDVTEKV